MVGPSHLKTTTTLHPLHKAFSMKLLPTASSTLSSMKIKTLIHTLIISHVCRIIRALSKAKTILIQILKENQPIQHLMYPQKNKYKNKKIFFGSFRLHYNWCSSSHVMPVPAPVLDEYLYYDSTWNSIISADQETGGDSSSQLSGYLQWLEEKVQENGTTCTEQEKNEIDKLADMFIANCHEKFRLEKVESYRRFQEMLARSM